MCGLAGVLGQDPVALAREQVKGMLHALRHRGPDGEGSLERGIGGASLVLGHRRLAIIDRSPAASQPMSSADGTLHLLLNGELYNHVELRVELERLGRRFRSRSDSEVLLEAWAAWGRGALDRMVGMFAFVLLDERRRSLILVRDQFAMKPLYYSTVGGRLAFASEITPLLALPGVSRRADPGPLADFVARAANGHPGRTLFADVQELPGAHLAEVSLDSPMIVTPECYWRPPSTQTHELSFAESAERVGALLEESVRLHLRSDVPVGLMLSGGQDSSALVALARRVRGPDAELHTFSYRGGGGAYDEGPFIDAACAAVGAIGHEVRLSPEEWAADLPALVAAQGEPFGSPVIYAQRRLFGAAAAQGIRVVLDGQGSDEFLAGYERYRAGRLASLLRPGHFIECASVAAGYANGGARWSALARGTIRLRWPALAAARRRTTPSLQNDTWIQATGAHLSPPTRGSARDVLRGMLGEEMSAPSLRWLMRFADRNAMAFSVENRLPFLTPPLVEFVLGSPEEHLIAPDGRGKQLLREAMRGVVPDVILDRRAKVGFDVPLEEWIARTPHLTELLEEATHIPAVEPVHARRLLTAVRSGQALPRANAFEVWRLVTLAAWTRSFGVRFD